jgi:hypothetical protein
MDSNLKDGLLAVGGGAAAASLMGLAVMAWKPQPATGETSMSYESRLLYTSGVFFAALGAAGLYFGGPHLRTVSLGALGLSGAGLLAGVGASAMKGSIIDQPMPSATTTSSVQTAGAMMGVRAPAVMQMDAALHHKPAPPTTWINTHNARRW